MFIRKLTMKNFKSVSDATLTFGKGITLFSGDNGEGKSTPLHAIILLLFNVCEMKSMKEYIKWGEDSFETSLDFSHEGGEYRISLSFNTKGVGKRELIDLNTSESWEGASAISKMAEIIDPDLARASMISMQDEKNLITTTPSQRREYLKKVYNLEFKDELATIASDIDNTTIKLNEVQGAVSALENMTYEHKELKELPSDDEVAHIQRVLESYDARAKEIKEKKNVYDEIAYKCSNLKLDIASLDSEIKSALYDIETTEGKIEEKKKSLENLERTDYMLLCNEEIEKLHQSFAERKESFKGDLAKWKEEYEKIASESMKSYPDDQEILDLKASLTEKQSELNHVLKTLESLKSGICPVCGKPVTSAELEKYRSMEAELKISVSDANEAYANAYSEASRGKRELEDWKRRRDEAYSQISSLESKLEKIDSDLENEEKSTKNLYSLKESNRQSLISSTHENIESLESGISLKRSSIDSNEKSREEKARELREWETKLMSLEDMSGAMEELEREFEEPRSWMKVYNADKDYNRSVVAYNEEMDRKEAEREEKLDALAQSISKLNADLSKMNLAKNIIQKEFPSYVISYMVETLKDYINEFLAKVYPKYEVSIEESRSSLNVTYGEYNADVKGASGFEKSVFSLAYMYALGKMQSYGCIIVDEGDGSASVEKSLKFYETIGNSTRTFSQIITITHKEEAKELLKNDFGAKVYTVSGGTYEEAV